MDKNEVFDELPPTTESSKAILPIEREAVHRICSGQVVVSLAIAVKELVENAIDAGATSIEVRLKEYGSELIDVIDNGSGIEEFNFKSLTLKHYTSKIRQFSDLSFVSTLGFRGEALSSLCALADLTVTTRHSSVECGMKIEYDHGGNIKNKTPCARQIGTTVALSNLFYSLPVRFKEFTKNLKREFSKMLELLYAYCIISKIRISCTNQTKKSPRTIVVQAHGSDKLRENIICVFGTKQIDTLVEINLHKPNEKILEEFNVRILPSEEIPFKFEGYISKCTHGSGRSTTDRQFYFMNSRPCEPSRLTKLVNEVYRSFNNSQYPFVVLNITIQQAQLDVNVTPDKRQIFMENEKLLLATIKTSLLEIFKDFPCTYKLQNTTIKNENKSQNIPANSSAFDVFKHFSKNNDKLLTENTNSTRGLKRKETVNKTLSLYDLQAKKIMSFMQNKRMKVNDDFKANLSESGSEDEKEQVKKFIKESYNSDDSDTELSTQDISNNLIECLSDLAKENKNKLILNRSNNIIANDGEISACKIEYVINNKEKLSEEINKKIEIPEDVNLMVKKSTSVNNQPVYEMYEVEYDKPPSPTSLLNRRNSVCKTTIDEISRRMKKSIELKEKNKPEETIINFRSEITSSNAEKELEKHIDKDMFAKMEIIGQFNKGFIITKLDSDLFIIDQHATDEKYNFETLQQTTVLENQKLVNPLPLELTAANENILIDNIDIFTKNGFTFNINENAEIHKKVALTAIPVSKNTQFGKEDIDELLFMLQDDSTSVVCRPSRVRAMFASRACRKSVMIGSALSKNDMRRLVDHMGQIDQPWNCPHGRPTMRHLINLNLIQDQDEN